MGDDEKNLSATQTAPDPHQTIGVHTPICTTAKCFIWEGGPQRESSPPPKKKKKKKKKPGPLSIGVLKHLNPKHFLGGYPQIPCTVQLANLDDTPPSHVVHIIFVLPAHTALAFCFGLG